MIFYGWRTTESSVGEGVFGCPTCRSPQRFRHLTLERWFTLYFIPLIPLGRVGEQVECQGCHSRFTPEALNARNSHEPIAALVIDETLPPPIAGMATPYQPAMAFGPQFQAAPQTSSLAISSLVLALISPILFCVCGLSLLSSLGAIVTGHLALAKIKRAPLQLGGRTQAIVGLVLGYLLLVPSILTWAMLGPGILKGWQDAQSRPKAHQKTSEDSLLAAELRVLTMSQDGAATGNTPGAKALAAAYSQSLATMRNTLFTEDRQGGFSLSKGQFIVHCELHPGRCAFIVHVPSYRDFSKEAKDELEVRAWQLARQTVESQLQEGDSLAVGLRGTALYGGILVGEYGPQGTSSYQRANREALRPYFPPEDAADDLLESVAEPTIVLNSELPKAKHSAPELRDSSPTLPETTGPQAFPSFAPPIPPPFAPPMPPPFVPPMPSSARGGLPPSRRGLPGSIPPSPFVNPRLIPKFDPNLPPDSPRRPQPPDIGRTQIPESLDDILIVLKEGEPTFAKMFVPLSKLRTLTPDPARREEVAALLDPLLTTQNSSVRRAAQDAVKVWGTQHNVPSLLALLDGADRSDRWSAMEALGKIGSSKAAAERIAQIMLISSESLVAKRALENMGSVAEDAVLPVVGHHDNLIHSYACQALGKIGTNKSLAILKSWEKDSQIGRQVPIDRAIREMERRLSSN